MFTLLITGPPGAGKTEVFAALSDALVADRTRHEPIPEARPSPPRRRR